MVKLIAPYRPGATVSDSLPTRIQIVALVPDFVSPAKVVLQGSFYFT